MPKELEQSVANALFHRRHAQPGVTLMDTLKRDGHLIAPGVYDAYGAVAASENYLLRSAEHRSCSYNAAYFGGWSVSAMLWHRPDMAFHDRTMMAMVGKYAIEAAYPLPVIMDAETGFGPEPVDLADTVAEYHRIGVALAHLEDQGTRRCGNLAGKACISPEEMVAKIRVWLIASEEIGTSMHLMARTDAFTAAGGGLDDAIDRMKRYMDTDYRGRRPLVSWADALIDPNDIEKWATELLKHDPYMILGINYSPNKDWTGYYGKLGRTPPTYDDLKALGFKVIWHTILQARADMESGWNVIGDMADRGAQALWDLHERQRGKPYGKPQAMSGADPWQALDKFSGGDAVQKRYDTSQGYKEEKKP